MKDESTVHAAKTIDNHTVEIHSKIWPLFIAITNYRYFHFLILCWVCATLHILGYVNIVEIRAVQTRTFYRQTQIPSASVRVWLQICFRHPGVCVRRNQSIRLAKWCLTGWWCMPAFHKDRTNSYLRAPLTFITFVDSLQASCITHKYVDDTTPCEIVAKSGTTNMQVYCDEVVQQSEQVQANTARRRCRSARFPKTHHHISCFVRRWLIEWRPFKL